jgi:hypothetical protein
MRLSNSEDNLPNPYFGNHKSRNHLHDILVVVAPVFIIDEQKCRGSWQSSLPRDPSSNLGSHKKKGQKGQNQNIQQL